MGEALDTGCRFVRIGDGVYLVRNLMSLRMKPFGMLVLGVDMDQLTAPMSTLARNWDARLDLRLDGTP